MGITRCKLSKKPQRRLLKFFVLEEVTARSEADLLGLHPNTTALFYRKVRAVIVTQLNAAFSEADHFEVHESYFGASAKANCGCGGEAAGKVPVFGFLKRGGYMYTQVIGNTRTATHCCPLFGRNPA